MKSGQLNKVVDTTILNNTKGFLKFNVPYSLAKIPSHLERDEINSRPDIVQRKNVHSYFKPTIADFVREHVKQSIKDKIHYEIPENSYQTAPSTADGNKRGQIPKRALFAVIDDQHIQIK